ncbi:hypothetical protein VPHD239_0205 [Vibrio phage D239]
MDNSIRDVWGLFGDNTLFTYRKKHCISIQGNYCLSTGNAVPERHSVDNSSWHENCRNEKSNLFM